MGSIASAEEGQRIRIRMGEQSVTATLNHSDAARDLVEMLPVTLRIRDHDLCYYAPWENLIFYYAGYRYSRGLIRLGRLDDGFEPLLARGRFPLHIEHPRGDI